MELIKKTEGIHISKVHKGYWILSVNNKVFYPFCGGLMIGKSPHYFNYEDALKSMENGQ